MERAQREADGPKRRILEAAARAKVGSAAGLPAALPVSLPSAVPRGRAEQPGQAGQTTEAEPAVASLPNAAAPLLLAADLAAAMPAPLTVPSVEPATAMLAVPPAAPRAVLPPLRLLSKVEPDLPARLFRRGGLRTELVLDLTVNTDGSVSNVVLRESPSADIGPPVLDAVRQWRYEAQPLARPHVVRLVVLPS